MGRIMRRIGTGSATQRIELGGTYSAEVETDNVTRIGNYIVADGSYVKKNNKVVDLYVKFTTAADYADIPAGGFTEVGSIPAKYYPSGNVQEFIRSFSGTTLSHNIQVLVTPEGKIETYNYMSANKVGITVHFTWITD